MWSTRRRRASLSLRRSTFRAARSVQPPRQAPDQTWLHAVATAGTVPFAAIAASRYCSQLRLQPACHDLQPAAIAASYDCSQLATICSLPRLQPATIAASYDCSQLAPICSLPRLQPDTVCSQPCGHAVFAAARSLFPQAISLSFSPTLRLLQRHSTGTGLPCSMLYR
jgi:hypothetical protein